MAKIIERKTKKNTDKVDDMGTWNRKKKIRQRGGLLAAVKHFFNPDPLKDFRDGPTRQEVKSDLQKKVDSHLVRLRHESFSGIDKMQAELEIQREGLRERQQARREKRDEAAAEAESNSIKMRLRYELPDGDEYERFADSIDSDEEFPDLPIKLDGQMSIADFIDAEVEEAIPPHSRLEMVQNRLLDASGRAEKAIKEKAGFVAGKIVECLSRKHPDTYVKFSRRTRIARIKFKILSREFWRRDARISAIVTSIVDGFDESINKLESTFLRLRNRIASAYNLSKQWLDKNKGIVFHAATATFIIVLIIISLATQLTAYEYSYNGKVLGKVRQHEDVYSVLDLISSELSREYDAEIAINPRKDIEFRRVFNMSSGVDSPEDVLTKLTYMRDMSVRAYAIYADGKKVAVFNNKTAAKKFINTVKKMYMADSENVKYEKIKFAENIKYKWIDASLGDIMRIDEAINHCMTGGEKKINHYVVGGDTLAAIAAEYGINIIKLQKLNPDANPEQLIVGQRIVVPVSVPMLTLQTIEIANYDEALPYEIEYKESDSIFKGERKVHRAGVAGVRNVKAKIVRHNGVEIAKIELEAKTASSPVTEVVYVGTKAKPSTYGSGSFSWPLNGRRSSGFGKRWGRMHNGIDLAAPVGTPIKAADGGTVVQAGYHGSYGYVVKINHGNGFVSIYAHCSKILVSPGTRVYKGQHIANVGNTGRSTGPHCHYEIQKGGVPVNPDKYTR